MDCRTHLIDIYEMGSRLPPITPASAKHALSFRHQLVAGVSLLLMGLWLTMSWLALGQLRTTFKRREASEATLWLQRASRALQPLVLTGRYAEAERLALGLVRQQPFYTHTTLRLYQNPRQPAAMPRPLVSIKQGHTVVSAPLVYQMQIQEAGEEQRQGDVLTFRESIRFEDRLWGQWTITVSDLAFAADLGASRERFLLVGAGSLMVFVALMVLLSGALTRPVDELTALGQRVAEGDLSREATPRGPAELQQVINTANTMQAAVRKRAEEQQERLAALHTLQQETQRLNQMQGDFTAAVSHELKTPLVSIEGYSRLLAENLEGQQGQDAENILTSALHLKGLINTLLDTVRLSQGDLALHPRPTHIETVLRDFRRMISYTLTRSQSEFSEDLRLPDFRVLVDPDRLLQIILNLVGNALKHAQGAPVRLTVHHADETLWVEVLDEGPGVPPDQREEVFAPFVQVAGALGKPEGTGLGLFIVRSLARNMGGDVTVQNHPQPGKTGALFVVRLSAPRVDA